MRVKMISVLALALPLVSAAAAKDFTPAFGANCFDHMKPFAAGLPQAKGDQSSAEQLAAATKNFAAVVAATEAAQGCYQKALTAAGTDRKSGRLAASRQPKMMDMKTGAAETGRIFAAAQAQFQAAVDMVNTESMLANVAPAAGGMMAGEPQEIALPSFTPATAKAAELLEQAGMLSKKQGELETFAKRAR